MGEREREIMCIYIYIYTHTYIYIYIYNRDREVLQSAKRGRFAIVNVWRNIRDNPVVGSSRMWCLRMWCSITTVV